MNNNEKINEYARKMGFRVIENNNEKESLKNIRNSKMMNVSKPNRPEVKEILQKQLDSIR